MPQYCVNRNRDNRGHHEVHVLNNTCTRLPNPENRVALGNHASCSSAVQEAKQRGYSTANGCYYCSPACNTG